MGPIAEAVVVVADIARATTMYESALGAVAGEHGALDPERAASWRQPSLGGAPSVVLRAPEDDRPGRIRLVESQDAAPSPPLARPGWSAIELLVADADRAMERAQRAGARVVVAPRTVGSGGSLRAAQVEGPAGELWYLTEVRGAPPGFDLPSAVAELGPVFIMVATCADLEESRARFEEATSGRRVTDHRLPIGVINTVHELPADTVHRISTVQLAGQSAIEFDQHAVATGPDGDQRLRQGVISVAVVDEGPQRSAPIEVAPGAFVEFVAG